MSLNLAIGSAVSSLLSIERQMALASNNISNANVAGYTNKSATVTTQISGGQGTGVSVTGISSAVNKYLLADIATALSSSGQASTYSSYYNSLQQALGEVTSGTSGNDLSSMLTNLGNALSQLAATPDDASLKSQVVSYLDQVTSAMRSTSAGIQGLRNDADQEISGKVDEINNALDQIQSLNQQIVKAKATGESTADLEDQRMTQLQTIAGDINVSYFVDSTGNMKIYTASNQPLLDSVVHHLSHQAASSISGSISYSATGGSGIDGIYVSGVDITNQISSGALKGLIDMRDVDLPKAQSELDNLASTLSSLINGIANHGTASPPPASLTGSVSIAGSNTVTAASGTTLRVELTDSSGKVTGYQDLDLSSATTVQDVVDSLNTVSGLSATISNGHLTIANSSGGGVAVATLSGSLSGMDVSSYFGLNDLVANGSSASTIAIRGDLLADSTILPTAALDTGSTPVVGEAAAGASNAGTAQKLADAMSGNQSFSAAGWLGSSSASLSQYAANLISDIAGRASSANDQATAKQSALQTLQTSFSSQSGVNVDQQTALLTTLQNNYAASAKVISTAQAMFQALLSAVQSA